jgi:hypothetical protein
MTPKSIPKNIDIALRNNTAGMNIGVEYLFSLNNFKNGTEKNKNKIIMHIEINSQATLNSDKRTEIKSKGTLRT